MIQSLLLTIAISAANLDWDKETGNLVSLESVQMDNPSMGTFTSSEKWVLQKENETFLALGSTTFTGIDGLKLTCSGSLEYDPKTEHIRAHGGSFPLSVEKDGLFFTAGNGEISYNDFQIETLTLTDSAQIKFHDFAATLEEIHFHKPSNSFVFLSKDGTIDLSHGETILPIRVEKVEMIKETPSSPLCVKGIGKVHFNIDETRIDQLLDSVTECIKSLY
jgi:hypothetical protein